MKILILMPKGNGRSTILQDIEEYERVFGRLDNTVLQQERKEINKSIQGRD